jgi:hypothetical protein
MQATYPRAVKEHVCEQCGRTIEPGESYRRQGYVWDGRMRQTKCCAQCERLSEVLYRAGFEGDEGGWPYLPEIDQGEAAHCGYGNEMRLFRFHWRAADGSLYQWPEADSRRA